MSQDQQKIPQQVPWWRGLLGLLIMFPGIFIAVLAVLRIVGTLVERLIVTICFSEQEYDHGLRFLYDGRRLIGFTNGAPVPTWASLRWPLFVIMAALTMGATYMIAVWVAGEDFIETDSRKAGIRPRKLIRPFRWVKPSPPRESSIPEKFRGVAANVDAHPRKPDSPQHQ